MRYLLTMNSEQMELRYFVCDLPQLIIIHKIQSP